MGTTPRTRAAAAGLALALALAAPAGAQQPAAAALADAALARLRDEAGGPVRIARHPGSGRVRTLRGELSPPGAAGGPEAAARAFLRERGAVFGLRPDGADLELAAVRAAPGGSHLVWRQTAAGLPVFNGGLEVSLDREQRVFLVHSEYVPADGLDPVPALAAGAAVEAVRRVAAATLAGAPQLGVFLDAGTPRLAWRFVLETDFPFAAIEHTVDARDGTPLLRRDLVQRLARNGWGRVFAPNPVNALRSTDLRDNADADGTRFAAAYKRVQLRALTYNPATRQYFLRGPHVNVSDAKERPLLFAATKGAVVSRTGSFLFGRAPDQFEHVMVYHYVDSNQRYIQGLGFTDVNRRPIRVDPHGRGGRDVSAYVASPVGLGYLTFGTGGVDDAEDADVILHEYAHALQDNQSGGKYLAGEAAAMGEGFADYWAASSTYDLSVRNGFDPTCVGEWNRVPGCMDRVTSKRGYVLTGNPETDGQIWSGLLWDIFTATADRAATDSIALKSHFLVPANPTFVHGGQALLDADRLLYGGAHKPKICTALIARGIPAPDCAFRATLTWDNPLVDLDLHLRPPDGADVEEWYYANDCYDSSLNRQPDWGIRGETADDPVLDPACDYDTNPGCALEQIVLARFHAPGPYKVLVHFRGFKADWLTGKLETTTATVSVYQNEKEVFRGSRLLANPANHPDAGDLWTAHTIVAP